MAMLFTLLYIARSHVNTLLARLESVVLSSTQLSNLILSTDPEKKRNYVHLTTMQPKQSESQSRVSSQTSFLDLQVLMK